VGRLMLDLELWLMGTPADLDAANHVPMR